MENKKSEFKSEKLEYKINGIFKGEDYGRLL